MDRFTLLAREARPCFAIMGNTQNREFVIVDLERDRPQIPEIARDHEARGLTFIGTTGLVRGVPKTALAVPIDDETMVEISAAIVSLIGDELDHRLRADTGLADRVNAEIFAGYMRQLMRLPDPRPVA